jgi:hypothetical protein
MFAKAYKEKGLLLENLSRTLEDSEQVNFSFNHNTCGASTSGTLGVLTLDYLPCLLI